MSLKIRLARGGAKKRPYYRIVIADTRSPRDGRFIEKIGSFNPLLPKDREDRVVLDLERAKHWLSVGALPTDRVARFLAAAGVVKRAASNSSSRSMRSITSRSSRSIASRQVRISASITASSITTASGTLRTPLP